MGAGIENLLTTGRIFEDIKKTHPGGWASFDVVQMAKPDSSLQTDGFLDVTNLLLDFAFEFFLTAFVLKACIADELAGCLFDGATHYFGGAFDFVMGTGFH